MLPRRIRSLRRLRRHSHQPSSDLMTLHRAAVSALRRATAQPFSAAAALARCRR